MQDKALMEWPFLTLFPSETTAKLQWFSNNFLDFEKLKILESSNREKCVTKELLWYTFFLVG